MKKLSSILPDLPNYITTLYVFDVLHDAMKYHEAQFYGRSTPNGIYFLCRELSSPISKLDSIRETEGREPCVDAPLLQFCSTLIFTCQ